jgi:hypothetical protein
MSLEKRCKSPQLQAALVKRRNSSPAPLISPFEDDGQTIHKATEKTKEKTAPAIANGQTSAAGASYEPAASRKTSTADTALTAAKKDAIVVSIDPADVVAVFGTTACKKDADTTSTGIDVEPSVALESMSMTNVAASTASVAAKPTALANTSVPLGPFRPKKVRDFRNPGGHLPRTKKCGTCPGCLTPNCLR